MDAKSKKKKKKKKRKKKRKKERKKKVSYLWKFHFTHSNSSVVYGFKGMGKENEG